MLGGTGHLREVKREIQGVGGGEGLLGEVRRESGGWVSKGGEERGPGARVFWGVMRGTAWEDWGMEMRGLYCGHEERSGNRQSYQE